MRTSDRISVVLIDDSVSRLLRVRRCNIWKTPLRTVNGDMWNMSFPRVVYRSAHKRPNLTWRYSTSFANYARARTERHFEGLNCQFMQNNSPTTYCLTEAMLLIRFLSIACGYINCVIPFKKNGVKTWTLCMWQAFYEVKTTFLFFFFCSCIDESVLFSFIEEFWICYSHAEASDLKKLLAW